MRTMAYQLFSASATGASSSLVTLTVPANGRIKAVDFDWYGVGGAGNTLQIATLCLNGSAAGALGVNNPQRELIVASASGACANGAAFSVSRSILGLDIPVRSADVLYLGISFSTTALATGTLIVLVRVSE